MNVKAQADADVVTANALVTTKSGLKDAALANKNTASADVTVQQGKLNDLAVSVANAQATVNTAAQAWMDAKANEENAQGLQTAVTNASNAVDVAALEQQAARTLFEDQTKDFKIFAGNDNMQGIQADIAIANDGVSGAATYAVITGLNQTVDENGAPVTTGTFGTYTLELAEVDGTGATPGQSGVFQPLPLTNAANVGDYIEFGTDDYSVSDLVAFTAANNNLIVKEGELATAEAANTTNFADLTATAKETYDAAAQIFADRTTVESVQQVILDAAIGEENTKTALFNTASTNLTTAQQGVTDANGIVALAIQAVTDAEGNLTTHLNNDEDSLASTIEDLEIQIAQFTITLASQRAEIDVLIAEKEGLRLRLDNGKPAELTAAEIAFAEAGIAEANAIAARALLVQENVVKATIIAVVSSNAVGAIQTVIDTIDGDIADETDKIATQTENIANHTAGVTIAQRIALADQLLNELTAKLVKTQARITLYTSLVGKFNTLVNSLL